ncbi:hemicentin-2-like [Aricia agestis]|uniref:hemicentin-2-like n=1 Tax=Aricia agestis TaxID=91739 RepID=UPI001C2026D6|nr:hemicentin-2-like [Aricia agestis]
MFSKMIIFFFIPFVVADKSLTIVLDVSASMREELHSIQDSVYQILKSITNKNINNYILVPFADPNVGTIISSSTSDGLVDALRTLELKWEGNCPEITVTAIKKALEASKPESYIYVFTDAQAKDSNLVDNVKRLCRTRLSQVFIFLSGTCPESEFTDDVYYEIVKSCNGSIFHLNSRSFHQAFFFMKDLSNVDWTEVISSDSFERSKNFTVSIDVYTENLIAEVSCLSPQFEILNDAKVRPTLRTIMRTHQSLVVNVQPQVGNYNIEINCDGKATAILYRRKTIKFEYGFSPKRPRFLMETSSKPLHNAAANILLILPEHYNAEIISVIIQRSDQDTKIIKHENIDEDGQKYVAEYTFAPGFTYNILIFCKDRETGVIVTGQSDTISPQKSVFPNKLVFPSAENTMTGPILINYGSKFYLSCKVIGYPEPEIWWEDDHGVKLSSEQALLETPFVYISYLTIDNAAKNSTVYCKSKNLGGENELLLEYYVNRTYSFNVIKKPSDTTITYDNEGKLFCEVDAYPEATTKWYHNNTVVENSENVEVIPDEHMLRINRMSLDDAGEYKCEVSNEVESRTFSASAYITGLDLPQIEIGNTEVILTPGDKTEVTCSVVKGTPVPEVVWKYKKSINSDSGDLPKGVSLESNTIQIESATVKHGGIYVCEATNTLGIDTTEVTVKVQYAPVIKNGDEVKIVRNGQAVALACDVDAVPSAEVHWDLYQDDVIIAFDDRHHTDKDNTHHFIASPSDSGMYHCTAENSMGSAVRTVTINVYVKPFINPLPPRMRVRSGQSTTISCNVKGNPMPTTQIEFTDKNLSKTLLLRDNNSTGKLDYFIKKVTKENEGTYECFSQSVAGIDSVTVFLKVD